MPDGTATRSGSRSTTAISSRSSRASSTLGQGHHRSPHRARQPRRQVGRPIDSGPTTLGRSACSTARPITTSTGRISTQGKPREISRRARLARLHGQILADCAGPAAQRRRVPQGPERRLSGRLRACPEPCARSDGHDRTRFFAGAKEKACSTGTSRPAFRSSAKSIDWGWFWFMRGRSSTFWCSCSTTVGNFGLAIIA